MAYIGSTPTSQNFISGTDYFNGTGSQTAFTLTRSVNSVNDVEVVVNNVIQQPNSYTVSGTTLTLSAAPSSGTSNVYVRYLATNQQSITVPANSIDYNKLDSNLQSKFAMKNRIINGAMVINQRGGTTTINSSAYTYSVDRFFGFGEPTDGVFTLEQSTTAPTGFNNSLKVTVTTADASIGSTQRYFIGQKIEGYNIADMGFGTASAKTFTISAQVQSSVTGTFGGVLMNDAFDRAYPFTYTISSANTWTPISIVIAGDTTGTWLTTNGSGLNVFFSIGAGSGRLGTAGAWQTPAAPLFGATGQVNLIATNGATFYITGVQLEVGSSATGFEYVNYQTSLASCQRYYTVIYDLYLRSYPPAVTTIAQSVTLPVQMRTNPTLTKVGTWGVLNAGQPVVGSQSGNAIQSFYFAYASVGSGDSYVLTGNSAQYVTASAEL